MQWVPFPLSSNSWRYFTSYMLNLSLSCRICFLSQLLGNQENFAQFSIESFDISLYVRLDAAAVRALDLLPSNAPGAVESQSVFGLLNKCRTAAGQRLLQQWIKQPLVDINKIGESLFLSCI